MSFLEKTQHSFKQLPVRRVLRLTGVCLLLSGAASASAETDALAEQFQRADWVSKVRIEGVGSLVQPSLSRPQMVAVQAYRYTASVLQGWKGGQSGTIRFEVNISDCHRLLEVDREYIVFGSTHYRGSLQSRGCADSISMEEAGELPEVLNEYSDPAG